MINLYFYLNLYYTFNISIFFFYIFWHLFHGSGIKGFMPTVCPSSDGFFQQDNAPWHKSQTAILNITVSSLHCGVHRQSAATVWCFKLIWI